ncbi:hypothetical protein Acid345_4417 [Candidatus Koribacter versatilis Ellin345]|uniref:Uncharacterized protein n=1 Tax=Koribacter versatilis (strain Ellin345) TaxID=204669 RepID=Q1II83_KORVE|nr:hypothetical protein [Candidatus Koribacter versatilis]ABF43417.1 hypothetical protein Acid345_4417 [Candidatus Koribacter versatilis Ellin345]
MKKLAGLFAAGALALTMLGGMAFAGDDYHTSYTDRDGTKWYASPGFDRGFRDGGHSGHVDAEHGFRFRASDHGQFRGGTDGWNGNGAKDAYRESYRAGYLKGYREAYDETMRSLGYHKVN